MGFSCGIIGLPNVGKSTIFNALSGAGAQMANYPFCTIDPNKGIVPVPDSRLHKIAELLQKNKPIQTKIEFFDVAGLVQGASKGEGLGNKFLDNIRNVDALVHVVRCFSDDDVAHIAGETDPVRDIEIINTELILSDIDVLQKGLEKVLKLTRSGDKGAIKKAEIIEKVISLLNDEVMLKNIELNEEEKNIIDEYGCITNKPVLYLANVDEVNDSRKFSDEVMSYAEAHNDKHIILAGKLEEEISELDDSEKKEYLDVMGLNASGLERLISASYSMLSLITYYTAETDLQAWTLLKGTTAVKAAGKIHTDFERGFIKAEVFSFNDLVAHGSDSAVKDTGLLRIEGKEYVVADGDIIRFMFNV